MKNVISHKNYYERKIDEQLLFWSTNKTNKTIALVGGVRRVGKTYALEHLGEKHFKKCVVIEVTTLSDSDVKNFKDKENRVENFCDYLLVKHDVSRSDINCGLLVIFDEIQEQKEIIESIDIFNNQLGCMFACTGSALWINDTGGTRPTPNYEDFYISPFSFEQFLGILGESTLYKEEKQRFIDGKCTSSNKELARLHRLYMVVGGMPQAIQSYLNNKDEESCFLEVHKTKKNSIVSTYDKDLVKYSSKLPLHLDAEYRIIKAKIGKVYDLSNSRKEYDKLCDMNLIINVPNALEINNKLSMSCDIDHPKAYILDIGILFYYYCDGNEKAVKSIYERFVDGKDNDNNGLFYENYVATTLNNYGHSPFYKSFDDNGESYELDFLFTNAKGVVVIEAKSGIEKAHTSLKKALKKYSKIKNTYILCNNYKIDKSNIQKGPHQIPFYALEFLLEE